MSKNTLLEQYIERLAEEEVDRTLIEEGMIDWVKQKLSAAGAAVAAGWEKVASKARGILQSFTNQISQTIGKLQSAQSKANAEYSQVVAAMQQGGGNASNVPGYKEAMALAKEAPAFAKEAAANKQQAVSAVQDVKQPTPETQQQVQAAEAYVRDLAVMTEVLREACENAELEEVLAESAVLAEEDLNEGGIMGTIGIALATPKLLMWTTGLLSKLAGKFKNERAQKLSQLLKHVGHWIHHKEEALFDKVIPNKAAFLYYRTKIGVKVKMGVAGRSLKRTGGNVLEEDEFVANDKIRIMTKMQMHKILLIPFLLVGLTHVLHAFHSIFSAADALATVAKTAEIGAEMAEVVGELGSLTAAVAETDPSSLLDITDVVD